MHRHPARPHTAGMVASNSPDDVDLRCAPWTAAQDLDPIGSAVQVDRFVAVEVPQPWPAKIEELDWMRHLPEVTGTRVQATVPETAREDGAVLLTRWERRGAGLEGTDWLVPAARVPEALSELLVGHEPTGGEATTAPAELLVCGHGTRDRCCGGWGTRLAVAVRAALPDLRVRRTSHLGGHRFAPTALTLPDGRLWSHLDAPTLVGIIHRTLDPTVARRHYRGNTALDPWAQVVEGDELRRTGWDLASVTDLRGESRVDDDRAEATLRWEGPAGSGTRVGAVAVTRRYPVLACGLPPEEATKDAVEYALVDSP